MSGARAAAGAALLIVAMVATVTIGAGPAVANSDCLALWSPGTWAPGSITGCAADLMASRPGSRPGPGPATGPALTAAFHGLPAAHNGQQLFTFELRFSQEFQGLRLTSLKQALEVTGGRLVDVKRTVRGQNRSVTVRVRPSSSGAVTVRLPGKKKLWNPVSATVAGPAAAPTEPATPVTSPPATPATPPPAAETPAPLTATFHGLPDEHNGQKLFSFEIRFSEEFRGLRLTALKRALQVTGGRVIDVRRTVRGQNQRVTVRVRPDSHAPVTVALGATTDCSAAGAICASDGRQLSGSLSANVTSPAWGPGEGGGTPYTLAALKSLNLHPPLPKNVVKTVSSSAPTGFPSLATGTVVNMNAMMPSTVVGGATRPNIQLRERYDRGGHWVIDFPCANSTTNPATNNICRIGGGMQSDGTWEDKSGVDAYGRWFTYPHDAGASDMKVHLLVRRATFPGENEEDAQSGKGELAVFFQRGHSVEYFYEHLDFFTANAHLEAPEDAVQPIATQGSTLTWTGKAIGLDTAKYTSSLKNYPNFGWRGDLIGGTATIQARFLSGGVVSAGVELTNLVGATMGRTYPNLSWASMTVEDGAFSKTNPVTNGSIIKDAKISGTFRGTGAATVGGTFEVPDVMVGGFVANK